MSADGDGDGDGGPGRREVAVRAFAAEFDDATHSYSEGDEERAPNYVVTPTGARVNRLFAVGVLTEVEPVNEEVLRGRVVDPTGAFVTYAGQYQPDEMAFLERTAPPAFVAMTGKARTFEPEDGDRIYSSVRPESLNAVDADTRDRWVVAAAEATLHRLAVVGAALETDVRGEELEAALLDAGVRESLAAGVPVALAQYGTTTGYLEAVRRLATDALETVAGDREEVRPLDVAPDEAGDSPLGPLPDVDLDLAGSSAAGAAPAEGSAASPADGTDDGATETDDGPADDPTAEASEESTAEATHDDPGEGAAGAESAPVEAGDADEADGLGDFEDVGADDGAAGDEDAPEDGLGDFGDEFGSGTDAEGEFGSDAGGAETGADAADEGVEEAGMYELDEAEREEVESEFGTEFSTGSEVDDPGEADIDVPDADDLVAEDETASERGDDGAGNADDAASADDAGDADPEAAADVDLESAAVDVMAELDDGDGAERAAVVSALVEDHGVDADAAAGAIEGALMSGQCYEPAEDRLKAI